jgi:hypothetical protein
MALAQCSPDVVGFDIDAVRVSICNRRSEEHHLQSPEQIARRLRHDLPEDTTMRISHEAIYQALYGQGRGLCGMISPPACALAARCACLGRAPVGGVGLVSVRKS